MEREGLTAISFGRNLGFISVVNIMVAMLDFSSKLSYILFFIF